MSLALTLSEPVWVPPWVVLPPGLLPVLSAARLAPPLVA